MSTHEHQLRSVAKAITFRVVATCAELVITFLLTHRLTVTLGVVAFSDLATTIVYYFHERIWDGIVWGRKQ